MNCKAKEEDYSLFSAYWFLSEYAKCKELNKKIVNFRFLKLPYILAYKLKKSCVQV